MLLGHKYIFVWIIWGFPNLFFVLKLLELIESMGKIQASILQDIMSTRMIMNYQVSQ